MACAPGTGAVHAAGTPSAAHAAVGSTHASSPRLPAVRERRLQPLPGNPHEVLRVQGAGGRPRRPGRGQSCIPAAGRTFSRSTSIPSHCAYSRISARSGSAPAGGCARHRVSGRLPSRHSLCCRAHASGQPRSAKSQRCHTQKDRSGSPGARLGPWARSSRRSPPPGWSGGASAAAAGVCATDEAFAPDVCAHPCVRNNDPTLVTCPSGVNCAAIAVVCTSYQAGQFCPDRIAHNRLRCCCCLSAGARRTQGAGVLRPSSIGWVGRVGAVGGRYRSLLSAVP
jgi:hypothetical protein